MQPLKALSPIDATFSCIIIDFNDLQFKKVKFPIDVTPFGIVIDDNDSQYEKA